MYFPYLYGRQSEFLALRSILDDPQRPAYLFPVIEPVNLNSQPLLACLKTFDNKDKAMVVIVNPDKHELNSAREVSQWQTKVLPTIDKLPSVVPAYRCTAKTPYDRIAAFLKRFSGRETAIVYHNPAWSHAELSALATHADVRFHIIVNDNISPSSKKLLPASKLVDIRDDFNKQERNADYDGQEYFTDRHTTYKQGYIGFGDFTCTGMPFSGTGGPPGAVAIHAIYKSSPSEIWMEHFVSDDTVVGDGNVADKFLQATVKLIKAVKKRPMEFGSNPALLEYQRLVNEMHFPNLATNKKMQIQHHICLILDVLRGAV